MRYAMAMIMVFTVICTSASDAMAAGGSWRTYEIIVGNGTQAQPLYDYEGRAQFTYDFSGATNVLTATNTTCNFSGEHNINVDTNSATNINSGSSTSTITIGNANAASSTAINSATTTITSATSANIVGVTNINTTASNATSINTLAANAAAVEISTGANNTGVVNINTGAGGTGTVNISSGASTGRVTIGNGTNRTDVNSSINNVGVASLSATALTVTNNIGVSDRAGVPVFNNIGTDNTSTSTNIIGSTNAGTTVTGLGGNTTLSVADNASRLVTAGAVGTSRLSGATVGTTGGNYIVMNGTAAAHAEVDGNGVITISNAAATESTAAITLTNGLNQTHGFVVTESKAVMSGGTNSTSLTLDDWGATFRNQQSGGAARVTGIADGETDFDAVNYRQLQAVHRKASSGTAAVAAIAGIPPPAPGKDYCVGFGFGNYDGQQAYAIGATANIGFGKKKDVTVKGGVAYNDVSFATSVGAGYSF